MLQTLISRLPGPFKALAVRFDKSPLDTVGKMTEFVQTRSSYISQTALYGYLKARMGTRFRVMFEDDVFSRSIRIAAIKTFASCAADLAIFASATAGAEDIGGSDEMAALAQVCFSGALEGGLSDEDREHLPDDVLSGFSARTKETHWSNAALGENAFDGSADDLLRFAPVIDEFKRLDEEIVRNSIRFRWTDIRKQWRQRVDGNAIFRDLRTK